MTQLVEAIMQLYEDEGPRSTRSRNLSASDGLASACERLAWYEYNSPVPRSVNPYLRRRFMYGNVHEDVIVDECSRLPQDKWRMKGSQLNINLWGRRGKVDLLVREGGTWKLLEIKTMNPEDFKKFQSIGMDGFPRYYEQSQFYLAGLGKIPFGEGNGIDSAILLAENTFPLGQLHAVEFQRDEDLIEVMEEKTSYLDEVVSLPAPPARPFTKDSPKCSHCFRQQQCWNTIPDRQKSKFRDHLEKTDPNTFLKVYNAYLEADIKEKEWGDKAEEEKRKLRNIMDEEGLTNLSVDFGNGLTVTIDLQEIHVPEKTVRATDFVRMDIRLR